ncbi:Ubiquitin-associated domain-containing protein 2 [Myotis davidii]|uniref:Ubiquitin-associated domain-containing protein 2 n=1 Tax=Myotis davidii TaxID=225400 RepID=L5MED5_MYODS|nr:Ubiquitin-associated domain-containing protein 2 [Myotis davidii]
MTTQKEEHEAPDSGLEKAARKGLECEGGVGGMINWNRLFPPLRQRRNINYQEGRRAEQQASPPLEVSEEQRDLFEKQIIFGALSEAAAVLSSGATSVQGPMPLPQAGRLEAVCGTGASGRQRIDLRVMRRDRHSCLHPSDKAELESLYPALLHYPFSLIPWDPCFQNSRAQGEQAGIGEGTFGGVARLMEMGFSRGDALEALRASNNDLNVATNFLLQH